MSAAPPSTPLRPTTTPTGLVLPPIWSFPPFFTLQPNPATRAHQLALWSEIILAWARHDRVFSVNADSPDGPGEVFANKAIGRKLLPPSLKQVLAHLAQEGNASPEPAKQTSSYLLYWRKPEEWGQIIYDWVSDNGFTGSIMTLYEITDGDLSASTGPRALPPLSEADTHLQEFRGLPDALLRRALDTLVRRGKAQILRGADGDGDGVRFL